MAVQASELGLRRQPEALASTLKPGERIALRKSLGEAGARPVLLHDPKGEVKIGNENVVVWKAPVRRRA